MRNIILFLAITLIHNDSFAFSVDGSAEITAGYRYFESASASYIVGDSYRSSPFVESELTGSFDIDNFNVSAKLYGSWDSNDIERTYIDFREAKISYTLGQFHLAAGLGNFFWGVSETINVVNVASQSDLRKDIDGKEKMGHQFVNFGMDIGNGSLNIFHFPNFVELSYPDRPSPKIPIVASNVAYESEENSANAVRWLLSADSGEIAFTYFEGIRRDPVLVPESFSDQDSSTFLFPYYIDTEFVSVDALYFFGDSTVKFEMKYGKEQDKEYRSYNVGFEYPFHPNFQRVQEFTWITEYLGDSRGPLAESFGQKDIMLGVKCVLGDLGDIDVRALYALDLEYDSKYTNIKIDKRLNNYAILDFQIVHFSDVGEDDIRLGLFENEDFAQVGLTYAF